MLQFEKVTMPKEFASCAGARQGRPGRASNRVERQGHIGQVRADDVAGCVLDGDDRLGTEG